MRHAKSSWDFPELSDHDRPLNKRGRNDAPLMGQQLLSRDVHFDLILTSTAVRALTTATLVAREVDYDREKMQALAEIYKADRRELIKIIQHVPDNINSLLVVGHKNKPPETYRVFSTAAAVKIFFRQLTYHANPRQKIFACQTQNATC